MGGLPTGTVTFLFADGDGSTDLLKKLRGRYHEVLAEHRRLLRAAFLEYGGTVVDTQGDGFFVAFPRVRDAIAAAVAAQRALTGQGRALLAEVLPSSAKRQSEEPVGV